MEYSDEEDDAEVNEEADTELLEQQARVKSQPSTSSKPLKVEGGKNT